MARLINGSTDYVNYGNPVAGNSIGCISFWMRTTQATANVVPMSHWSVNSRQGWGLIMNNSAGKLLFQGNSGSVNIVAISTTSNVNTGADRHIAINYNRNSGAANAIFADGTQEATGNSSAAWATANAYNFRIGDQEDAFWPSFVGTIWDVAMWYGSQLSAEEIAALAKGYSPKLIKPDNLELYAPLVRDLHDVISAKTVTSSGGSVADHGRVIGGVI
jgi:hypothetical protein